MKKLSIGLCILFGLLVYFDGANALYIPEGLPNDCIQYRDECNNMCIRRKNDTWKCETATCEVKQQVQCVSKTNDVYNGQIKVDLPSSNPTTNQPVTNQFPSDGPLIPRTHRLFPTLRPLRSTGTNTSLCDSVGFTPVCGIVSSQCSTGSCLPVFNTFDNKCKAENAGAKDIKEGVCPEKPVKKKKNILKRRTIRAR